MEMKEVKYMLEIDILRNSSEKTGCPEEAFKDGFFWGGGGGGGGWGWIPTLSPINQK